MQERLITLLADDDENDVILLRRAIHKVPLVDRLIVVPDGEDVIPYLRGDDHYADRRNHPFPDLLVLDRRMPRLSGLDVLFWMRTEPRFATLPVVVFSNGFSPQESEMVLRLNAACSIKSSEARDMPHVLEEAIIQARRLVCASLSSSSGPPA